MSNRAIPMTIVAVVLAVGSLAACAQNGGSSSTRQGAAGSPRSGMQGMSMQQQMEHCRQMQGADHSQMGPDMQRMMQECDAMMRSHGGPGTGSAPSTTP